MIIALIGLRGAGKSTIGQALADRLECRFADLDRLTLAALGAVNVHEVWAERGESAFRQAESEVLAEALQAEQDLVLALGGGTPTAPGAADALRAASKGGIAKIVYLRAQPAALAARITTTDPNRPSLTGADPVAEMADVFAQRDPLYRELADIEIDASQNEDAVLAELCNALGVAESGGQ